MATLVSLADAKLQLHVTGDDRNADVELKMRHASEIVIDYLGTDADDAWTATTAPAPVQAAVLIALTHLYENRGDDLKSDESFWNAMKRYLERRRTPVFA